MPIIGGRSIDVSYPQCRPLQPVAEWVNAASFGTGKREPQDIVDVRSYISSPMPTDVAAARGRPAQASAPASTGMLEEEERAK
ncbi:hypothetical protein [Rhizobium sp. 9140]|uniref:hypothetical protein n=1 Tax=Rhizobium sp. 9140 TaxID=1761900 RepID=UPI000A7B9B75|nr:hypothetical protein [Rhizobium sp. 9140]